MVGILKVDVDEEERLVSFMVAWLDGSGDSILVWIERVCVDSHIIAEWQS